jgi:hypothetical protein
VARERPAQPRSAQACELVSDARPLRYGGRVARQPDVLSARAKVTARPTTVGRLSERR